MFRCFPCATAASSLAAETVGHLITLFLLVCAFGGLTLLGVSPRTFTAVSIHAGDNNNLLLTAFPMTGPKQTITLRDLPRSVTVNAFSADAMYLQPAALDPAGITKVQFRPLRMSVVAGSAGFPAVWNLTALPSGLILVAGLFGKSGECGTFEVDPAAGTSRALLAGRFPDCGGGGGTISPDGTKVVSYNREELSIVSLNDHTIQAIKGIPGRAALNGPGWPHSAAWSPNGKWISVVLEGGNVVLVDTIDTSKRRSLGRFDGPPVWSPDAEHLLGSKSELSCKLSLYFESLQVIDVATGKKTTIPSSHCEVGAGWYGWVDSEAIR